MILGFWSFKRGESLQEPWKAPKSADTLKNPYQAKWGENTMSPLILRETQQLYNTYCATCHGRNGAGDGNLGADLKIKPANFHSDRVKEQKDGALFWKLSYGRGEMPAYRESFTDQQRWQLVTYIRQMSDSRLKVPGVLKFDNADLSEYRIRPGVRSEYFAVPSRVSNLIHSEALSFMVDTVVTGLKRAWSMAFLPDASMLIAERSGNLLRVRNGKTDVKHVQGNIPVELRDIKLHPDFSKNKLVYLSYYILPAKPEGGYTALMRGKLEGDRLIDEEKIYQAGPFNQGAFWYGSKIAFDKENYLFFTVGISGDRKNAQDLSNHAGKTMRLKDDGSLPDDNPFMNVGGALPEIYSYGHRMHEGLLYSKSLSKLFSTEFGELGGDELNEIKPGANYGWPEVTFSLEYSGLAISADSVRSDIEPPLQHWKFAPSDLDMVSGENYREWDGNLFIGGLADQEVLRVVMTDGKVSHDERLLENIGRVRDVKFGPDKLLYVLTEDSGIIIRLIPVQRNN